MLYLWSTIVQDGVLYLLEVADGEFHPNRELWKWGHLKGRVQDTSRWAWIAVWKNKWIEDEIRKSNAYTKVIGLLLNGIPNDMMCKIGRYNL